MPLITLLILAVVQGLTEFLPVSSSGHLSLLYSLFGMEDGTLLLSIILHISTLFSVMIYYRKDIITLIKKPLCNTNKKIIVTTITTSIVVLLCKPIIDKLFAPKYLFIFFILTAFILFISDYMTEKQHILSRTKSSIANTKTFNVCNITDIKVSYKAAIIIGLVQGIATIPGISRSGSTIATSSILGIKEDKTKYSFLISIPIIILSLVYELMTGSGLKNINPIGLIIAFVVCFFVGLISIKWVEILSKKNTLSYFGYYLLALSTFIILGSSILHLF